MFGNNQLLHIIFLAVGVLIEISVIVVYFFAIEDHPPGQKMNEWWRWPLYQGYAMTLAVFGGYYIVHWVTQFAMATERVAEAFRFSTVIFLLTGPVMLILGIVYDPETHFTLYCPVFLRAWWAVRYMRTLAFIVPGLSKPVRAIIVQIVFVLATLITCVGIMQYVRHWEQGGVTTKGYVDVNDTDYDNPFSDVLYFTVVTLTTVGYGDITPTTWYSQIVVVFEIFIAMILLPVITNEFAELVAYFEAQRAYTRPTKHILVIGNFTPEEAGFIFREHLDRDHQFSSLHLVFLSPEQYHPDVIAMAESYQLKNRVTLTVGNPTNVDDLKRFAPRSADAALFYSSPWLPAQRGDYKTILLAILLRRYDPHLPQYFMLKRKTHSRILRQTAFVTFSRDETKYKLLGASLQVGGFLSFFVNLVRPTRDEHTPTYEDQNDWFDQYRHGAGQSVYFTAVPNQLFQRSFGSVALILFLRCGILPIGLARKGQVQLNPSNAKVLLSDKLIIVGPSAEVVHLAVENFGLRKAQGEEGDVARELRNAPTAAMGVVKRAIVKKTTTPFNCYPFRKHVVLVDVSGARPSYGTCQEESVMAEQARSEDLLALVSHFPKTQPFVLVSLSPMSETFQMDWVAEGRLPIFHIQGNPLRTETIDMACVKQAMSVLIFATEEGADSDVLRTTIMSVQATIFEQVAGTDTPVISVFETQEGMPLLEPRAEPAMEPEVGEECDTDSGHTICFATAGGIATSLLDSLLFRTYYNQYLPQVVEQLLAVGRVKLEACTEYCAENAIDTTTYAHLCRIMSGQAVLALGLARVVTDGARSANAVGRRFFWTNPPPRTLLQFTDRVMYLVPGSIH